MLVSLMNWRKSMHHLQWLSDMTGHFGQSMKMRTANTFRKNMSPPRRGMDWNMLDTKVIGGTYHQNQRTSLMRECKDFRFPLHELIFDSGFSSKVDSKHPN